MKMKWYLSTIVLVLAFLGICSNQISSPNQEILLKFNAEEVTNEQSQTALEAIKQQLYHFGIESFYIQESQIGEIRISYHSSISIENIKQAFSKDQLGINVVSFEDTPKNEKLPSQKLDFNLDVYELQKNSDHNSAGKTAWVVKQDYDRFLNPHFSPFSNHSELNSSIEYETSNNVVYSAIRVTIKNTFYIIPEVRAGPKTSLDS